MGTPGVPFDKTDDEIREAIKKARGRLTHASKYLSVHHSTLYHKLNANPHLWECVHETRKANDEYMLDMAEDTLLHAISKRDEDGTNALKSSFFILNNKGRSRGYNPPTKSDGYDEKDRQKMDALMKVLGEKQTDHSSEETQESIQ